MVVTLDPEDRVCAFNLYAVGEGGGGGPSPAESKSGWNRKGEVSRQMLAVSLLWL